MLSNAWNKKNIKEVIGTIVNLWDPPSSCGDVNRNVMAPAALYEKVLILLPEN